MNCDDELISGYIDGLDLTNPYPSGNRSPFYIHGFLNGRDDRNSRPRKTAQEIRNDLSYLGAVFNDR